MRQLIYIGLALAMFDAAFLYGADAHAASGYWNNSGFSISHEFYPGLHRSYSYYNYAPSYHGFNRFYFGGSRPHNQGGPAEAEERPAPINWAKKCGSSCLDLSSDRD
jgi:hypothetical protein